jgi:Tol biopolymer transport system component
VKLALNGFLSPQRVIEPSEKEGAVNRALASDAFARDAKARELLVYLFEKHKNGQVVDEPTIAEEFFHLKGFASDRNSRVRTSMLNLRTKLNQHDASDRANNPIKLEVPARQYGLSFSSRNNIRPTKSGWPKWMKRLVSSLVLMAMVIVGAIVVQRQLNSGFPWTDKPSSLRQLTHDGGLASDPAISHDGKYIAYASAVGKEGPLRIRVQNLAHGFEIQLGKDDNNENNEYEPDFSPDDALIAFRSDRDGGGVYTVPLIGGSPNLIIPKGRGPRFSPDGTRICFWVGEPFFWNSTKILVTTSQQPGKSTQIAPEFYDARSPVWSPDGRILFRGQEKEDGPVDWWVAGVGGAPRRLSAQPVLNRADLNVELPAAWWRNYVFFWGATVSTDSTNLWKIAIQDSKVVAPPHPLTLSTAIASRPSVSDNGMIAFSSRVSSTNIFELAADTDHGRATGEPQPIEESSTDDVYPSFSRDRRTLVFASERGGKRGVWRKNLPAGQSEFLFPTQSAYDSPKISPDGSSVAYLASDKGWQIRVAHLSDRMDNTYPDCGPPRSFSSNGSLLLYEAKDCSPDCIGMLNTTSGVRSKILADLKFSLSSGTFSPDDHWVAFQARIPASPAKRQIFVARLGGAHPLSSSDWIAITNGEQMDREPQWSPNGRLLYFLSERDGFRCIMAQPLSADMRPTGPAFAVKHFHDARRSLMQVGNVGKIGFSVLKDRLIFSMTRQSGEIWLYTGQL